jgi:myo-inositol-1(or 4)-monophosphatase
MAVDIDLAGVLGFAEAQARRAGASSRQIARQSAARGKTGVSSRLKHDKTDAAIRSLVTRADVRAEKLIADAILAAYPEHHIVGEEGGGMGAAIDGAPYRWYIDPLDGTTNYAHGLPHWCVSVALAGPDGVPLAGVVYAPMLDECFAAARGAGATLNGAPIRVSRVKKLDRAVLGTGFPADRKTNPDNNTAEIADMARRCYALRAQGAVALDLCYVAAGRLDGLWIKRVSAWDVMAGLVIAAEAGATLSDMRGALDGLYTGASVAASNGLIHDDMLAVLVLGA